MVGGLLNLVAVGNQNIILHGNPQKTFWSSTYKRITNFGIQNFRLDYEGLRQLNISSETNYSFKVKRYAELLMDMYVVIQMPDIYSPIYPQIADNKWVPYEFKWIKNLGAMMIKSVKFTIGGNLIQQFTGTDIVILANRDLNSVQKRKWDEMIGNTPDMNDPANAFGRSNIYPNAVYNNDVLPEPSIRGKQLRIPLPVWWGFTSQQAFPLVALQYNVLQVDITLRPIRELYQIKNVLDTNQVYPFIAPNMTVSEYQFHRFLQPPPNLELQYITTNVNWNENTHISAQYCFLSEDESKLFALHPQKYLVKEYHNSEYKNISVSDKIWLQNSSGLVIDWMFLFQRNDVPLRNEWSNFTNWEYDSLPSNVTILPPLLPEDESGPFGIVGYGRNPSDQTPTLLYSTGDYTTKNIKNILVQLGIQLDGIVREEVKLANFYLQDQQYLTCPGFGSTTLNGLYVYNFSLNTSPFQLQPSGAINLSKFSKIEFDFTTITPPIDPNSTFLIICDPIEKIQLGVNKSIYKLYEYGFNLYVLEERYNVITFLSGNAAMMNAR
jgi:hypothetical protein